MYSEVNIPAGVLLHRYTWAGVANFRAARIEAIIPITRFRDSSTKAVYHFRLIFAINSAALTVRQLGECGT